MMRTGAFWRVPPALKALLVIPFVTTPLAGVLLALLAFAWSRRRGGTRVRIFWNLSGFHY